MTAQTPACWADPLSRQERRVLAARLARACKSFWAAATVVPGKGRASFNMLALSSAEMSELHLDVTERAS